MLSDPQALQPWTRQSSFLSLNCPIYKMGAVRSALTAFQACSRMKQFTVDEHSLDVNLCLHCNDLVQQGWHGGMQRAAWISGYWTEWQDSSLKVLNKTRGISDLDSTESDSPATPVFPVKWLSSTLPWQSLLEILPNNNNLHSLQREWGWWEH